MILDPTSSIGIVLTGLTNNVTGSWFLTLLYITFIIIILATALNIPLIFTAPIIIPLLIISLLISGLIMPILGITLIYIAIIIGKSLFF